MKVALAQVDCALGDVDANAKRALDAVAEARHQGAEVVVFPELSLTGYSLGQVVADVAVERDDPRLGALAAAAGEEGAVVVGFAEATRRLHTYNSAAWLEGGGVAHVHRKLYLPTYGAFEERKHFSPGQAMRAFDTRLGRVALLVCNDAWQPALPFVGVQDGAEVLVIPTNSAASPYPDVLDTKSYWTDITRFYARMLECYVVFVNRVGTEGDFAFWGGSHVVDPWGRVVAQAPDSAEALVLADVDVAAVRRRRREVPLVREARLSLLSRELSRLADEGGDL